MSSQSVSHITIKLMRLLKEKTNQNMPGYIYMNKCHCDKTFPFGECFFTLRLDL